MEKSKSRSEFVGTLSKYQENNRKTYMEYEQDRYTPYQNYLYKRALYGIESLSKEELERTCSKKLERIKRIHIKAQKVLNRYKQKLTIDYTNLIFLSLWPESPFTTFMLNNAETDDAFVNKLTFKDLNISKDDIVDIFISEGVLPKNFKEILINPNQLPRLKNEIKTQNV